VPRDLDGAWQRLLQAGVQASLREGAIRLSPHLYNTAGDIARLLDVLPRD
jgi:selenocysteine lyase/cysteine desulfurase